MNFLQVAVLIALVGMSASVLAQPRVLNSFATPEDRKMIRVHGTRVTPAQSGIAPGEHAVEVEFLPGEWPNVMLAPDSPWDWTGGGALTIEIANPGKETVSFGVRVDDDVTADGAKHCRQATGHIAAGRHATFALPLGQSPMSVGMRGLPSVAGAESLGDTSYARIDLTHIVQFQVFLHAAKEPVKLLLGPCKLVSWSQTLDGIVDRFGQYAGADWPGKLHDEKELATRLKQERDELSRTPQLAGRDEYGAWSAGPARNATGYFRTEKVDGKCWLVAPNGHLFFSMGTDCVGLDGSTITTGREKMFSWLPGKDDPLARFVGHVSHVHSGPVSDGASYDFLRANIYRKYGSGFEPAWFDIALQRLRSWGFNTIGNWSDSRLYGNRKVPYVATAGIGGSHARLASGSDYWGKMHDPFDPQFEADVRTSLQDTIGRVKGDPWCVGYFVDNELSWGGAGEEGGRYGLGIGALGEAPTSYAKQSLLAQLKAKYSEIGKLNVAWNTTFADWAALDTKYTPPSPMPAAMKTDLGKFVKNLARRYFQVIRDVLKDADPDHLYMGCRFAWQTPDAVAASAEICDVVSFNFYVPKLDPTQYAWLKDIGKPVIIGEFHFGALDRGMFHTGLVATANQQERAETYIAYLHSALDNPAVVGCHWFQYVDEPLTGRTYDGENYNIGFLTVTDTPYPEMVAAARKVHGEAYERRGR